MSPQTMIHDAPHGGLTDAEACRDVILSGDALDIRGTYLSYQVVGQFGPPMPLASSVALYWAGVASATDDEQPTCSTFPVRVTHVVSLRPEPQMVGVPAGGSVTCVQHEHAWWDGADVEFIRESMCLLRSVLVTHPSVAMSVQNTSPNPTGAFHMTAPPQTFQKGSVSRKLVWHNEQYITPVSR